MKIDKNVIFAEGMRESGKRLGIILKNLRQYLSDNISKGITKNNINDFLKSEIKKQDSIALFLGHDAGYGPFPKETIVCINNEIVHAIPDNTPVTVKDLITIDIGIKYNGFCSDAARNYSFANNDLHNHIMKATEEAFFSCTKIIKDGTDVYDLGRIISQTAKKYNLRVFKDLTGHGIGRSLWEEPSIFQFPCKHYSLKKNKAIAIEPIFTFGNSKMLTKKDKWTLISMDDTLSAQYENTILITENGCEILTIEQ